MLSLAEFAKTKKGATCVVCTLPKPIKEELIAGWQEGIRGAAICPWLAAEHNVEVTRHALSNHFENNHEARANAD